MNRRIAIIVPNVPNPWFKIAAMDEHGNQQIVHEGPDLGRALTFAASVLGHALVIPVSGPDTTG